MPRTNQPVAVCAEKSDVGAVCGEIIAAPAAVGPHSNDGPVAGLLAMNMLRIPKSKPLPARASRKERNRSQSVRLELTLEMPAHRPIESAEPKDDSAEVAESPRGVAEIDFYI